MRLANGFSILFILSKNQLLALLIFAMVTFVYFAFISALIFKISFLLLTLGFFISSFLVALGVELGYLFEFFLVSWGLPIFLWAFPLALLLQWSIHRCDWGIYRFWVVMFSFSFISMHILISFLISSVICLLFNSLLFSLHMLEFLIVFLL